MYYTDDLSLDAMPPAPEWRPVWWTPMKSKATLGDDLIEFIETYHTPPRGDGGEKAERSIETFYSEDDDEQVEVENIKLAEWQKWLLRHIFELDTWGRFRYREVYIQIPRKHGKSMLMSGVGNYFLTKGKRGDRIYFAAKDSDQARIMYEEAKRNIDDSVDLSSVLETFKYISRNQLKDIEMKPLASSTKGAHGLAPYISLCDEIHTWDSATGTSRQGIEMLQSLLTGSGDRKEKMVLEITTAGSNLDGIAYSRYQKGKMLAQDALQDDRFGFFCWEAEEHDDIFDDATLRKANPGIVGGWISIEELRRERDSAAQLSTADFERYNLNKWLRRGDKSEFLTPFHWGEIRIDDHMPLFEQAEFNAANGQDRPEVVLGFDGSLTEDSTGIVAIDLIDNVMEVLYKWEKDPTDPNWFVDQSEVDAAMRKCFELFDVKKVYLDPSRHWDLVKVWQNEFGPMIVRDIPPSAVRMAPLSDTFRNDVTSKNIFHSGDQRFTEHVMNAILNIRGLPAKETRNSHRKIDFLVCAILANAARHEYLEEVEFQRWNQERWGNF